MHCRPQMRSLYRWTQSFWHFPFLDSLVRKRRKNQRCLTWPKTGILYLHGAMSVSKCPICVPANVLIYRDCFNYFPYSFVVSFVRSNSFVRLFEFVRSFIRSNSFVRSSVRIRSFVRSFARSFVRSCVCLFAHSFVCLFFNSFPYSFIRSIVRLLARWFVRSLIFSIIQIYRFNWRRSVSLR